MDTNNLQMKGRQRRGADGRAGRHRARDTGPQGGRGARDQRRHRRADRHRHQPAVGLGTFLAQFLLRQPLQAANTQEFRVTGTWADPHIDKVQPALAAPAPAGETQPPAPAPAAVE
jgi:hypothetical protein